MMWKLEGHRRDGLEHGFLGFDRGEIGGMAFFMYRCVCGSMEAGAAAAGEEERDVGDVRRMPGALNVMQLRQNLLDQLRVGGQKVENGRIDTAGAYAIDANVVLRHFERDRASEVDDSGLGGAVRVRPVPARETSNGGG